MKRSLELMRAERTLRSAATAFTDVIYDKSAPDIKLRKAEEALYDAARKYTRLAELAEAKN